MRKILIGLSLILTCFFNKVQAQSHDNGYAALASILLNLNVGYQQGFSTKSPTSRSAFDSNLTLVLLNIGYSHQQYYGSNGYIGLGVGTLAQAQYGFGFNEKKRIGRLRSDLPIGILFSSEDKALNALSVGIFAERDFHHTNRGNSFGFSLTANLVGVSQLFSD